MLTTRTLGRWLAVPALLALALGQQLPAGAATAAAPSLAASVPTPPPGCPATTHTFTQTTSQPIPDATNLMNGIITSTIHVSGLPQFAWNVTAQTAISHTFPSDLNIYLLAPNEFGFQNTLSTGNGGNSDNVFANTVWSDQAPLGVTQVSFANNINQPSLIPEGAMGAHYAHNPNGDWRLVIADGGPGDIGILNHWSLSVTTLPFTPIGASQFPTDNTAHAIPNPGTLTATLTVNGAGPVLDYLTLRTSIAISHSGDLTVRLISPTGLTTTLVNSFGGDLADQFNGTLWTDDPVGGGPVTDAIPVDGQPLDQVQPVGAMRHFAGTNPNGVWKLVIQDVQSGGSAGQLTSWQMGVYTGHCDGVYLPAVRK